MSDATRLSNFIQKQANPLAWLGGLGGAATDYAARRFAKPLVNRVTEAVKDYTTIAKDKLNTAVAPYTFDTASTDKVMQAYKDRGRWDDSLLEKYKAGQAPGFLDKARVAAEYSFNPDRLPQMEKQLAEMRRLNPAYAKLDAVSLDELKSASKGGWGDQLKFALNNPALAASLKANPAAANQYMAYRSQLEQMNAYKQNRSWLQPAMIGGAGLMAFGIPYLMARALSGVRSAGAPQAAYQGPRWSDRYGFSNEMQSRYSGR